MPAYSSLRTFVNSLRTGQTNITETFVKALADPNFDPSQSDADSKVVPLSPWIVTQLKRHGMEQDEIDHLNNEWPSAKKYLVRQWVHAAVTANPKRSVAFSWELFAGDDPDNSMVDPGAPDPVSITFLSPRQGVRLSRLNFGSAHVER